MSQIQIQVNLSIDKSGGAEKLPVVIKEVEKAITAKYPDAEVSVRKGFFQTIDGIWASDSAVEQDIFSIVDNVRKEII